MDWMVAITAGITGCAHALWIRMKGATRVGAKGDLVLAATAGGGGLEMAYQVDSRRR